MDIIKIEGLKKTYDDFILGPIDLNIAEGSLTGLIGRNGMGKTSLIKLLLGLLVKDQGKIRIFGQDMDENPSSIRDRMAFVFDELDIPAYLKISQLNDIMKGLYSRWDEKIFHFYLDKFSLKNEKKIEEFSRGMKMKLSLALALSHEADILILDEATSGMDPIVRGEVLDILLEFREKGGTIIFSTHILSDLEDACDYIVFMDKGKIILNDNKDSLLDSYGLFKGSKEELSIISEEAIVSKKDHKYYSSALLKRDLLPDFIETERASLEDIMEYFVGGKYD